MSTTNPDLHHREQMAIKTQVHTEINSSLSFTQQGRNESRGDDEWVLLLVTEKQQC